ncbi:MAG: secondary thiamine-phosphate synthase enzyme YjbQ [Gemmatimonadales bacterium]
MDLRRRFQPNTALATHRWTVRLAAEFGHADITPELRALVGESGVQTGVLTVQMLGSTGAITTIEYESGALSDLRRALDLIAPVDADYAHNARWGDGNGFSHVRSALLKTSLSLPVVEGEVAVGTWQQVVALNLDNRERMRELIAVLVGSA